MLGKAKRATSLDLQMRTNLEHIHYSCYENALSLVCHHLLQMNIKPKIQLCCTLSTWSIQWEPRFTYIYCDL